MTKIKSLLLAVIGLLYSVSVSAYHFEVGRIYYNITSFSNKTVEVTYKGWAEHVYSGSVVIPASVTYEGDTYSVTRIGEQAFNCCPLTNVEIPNSVTSIGANAFYLCTNLTSIEIPNSVTIIESSAFSWAGLTSIAIPNSVSYIAEYAFVNCSNLLSVSIPNSVTTIREGTFSDCYSLQAITIPNSVTCIGKNAFRYCSNLTSVVIPNSVISIETNAFENCGKLSSVMIGDGVTSIGDWAFYNCALSTITIPNNVVNIGSGAFQYCSSLTSVSIGSGVNSIAKDAFSNTQITTVNIDDMAAWCNIAFSNDFSNPLCSAKSIFLKGELVTELVIPSEVTSIGSRAFNNFLGLNSVTIPESVVSIGDYAFYYCTGLKNVTSYIPADKLFSLDSRVFGGVYGTLYVPHGAKETYASTPGWQNFMNIVEMSEDGTTDIDKVQTELGRGNAIYDLYGRKLNHVSRSGFYILNGKKVWVK